MFFALQKMDKERHLHCKDEIVWTLCKDMCSVFIISNKNLISQLNLSQLLALPYKKIGRICIHECLVVFNP